MKILVACEESQAVTIELRKLGHEAYSCDIVECSGGHPEWHIRWDALALINGNCSFVTCDGELHSIDGRWDMLIAHPPCTYMSKAGARWMFPRAGEVSQERLAPRTTCAWYGGEGVFLQFFERGLFEDCCRESKASENNRTACSDASDTALRVRASIQQINLFMAERSSEPGADQVSKRVHAFFTEQHWSVFQGKGRKSWRRS